MGAHCTYATRYSERDLDLALTDICNNLSDDQYNGFLKEAEDAGVLDAADY